MSAESEIRAAIRSIAGINELATSILCTVVSVDEDAMTCEVTPIDGGENYMDVRLMADPEGTDTGFYLKPTVNSVVMITPQDEVTYFVSMTSKVSEVWLHGNQYDGLVKVGSLKIKLNNVEGKVNDLIAILQGISIPLAPSGTYPFAPLFASTTPLTPTQQADIENDKVLHG
jgi:hypothetical protein